MTAAPSCPWCGGATRPAGRRLVACVHCHSALTFPRPDDAELAQAYGGAYRPADGRFSAGADRLLARTRGTLARRIAATAPPGPVLDVGSGDGSLLDALAAAGREAVGLERDPGGRADTHAVEITDFTERSGTWAAVVLWHSLEHLRDAPAALAAAAGLLAPGGVLIVAVPNRDSWQARVLGDRWLALDLPRHLHHLTARALLTALRAQGLEVERVSAWRGGQVLFGWLHGLVAALPGHPDLYDAIRRPPARLHPMGPRRRAATLLAGALLTPPAALVALAEVLAGHGGSVFVQARRPAHRGPGIVGTVSLSDSETAHA
ncbi:MAG TPA: class I SAM-dependent methyltransferase [Solirubrobacteraceae bacterium]|nr:class I SAM-dependent methyltransferase [Solirubrobacteraceae bacterium]